MKREEAEKLAAEAVRGMGLNTKGHVTDAILSAYRKGAEEMRERAAHCVATWRWGNHDNDCTVSAPPQLVAVIFGLPLTDDPKESNEDDQAGP